MRQSSSVVGTEKCPADCLVFVPILITRRTADCTRPIRSCVDIVKDAKSLVLFVYLLANKQKNNCLNLTFES